MRRLCPTHSTLEFMPLGEKCTLDSDGCDVCYPNSTVDDRERRKALRCSLCPPNKGENAKRRPKHGKTKPKSKDKRR